MPSDVKQKELETTLKVKYDRNSDLLVSGEREKDLIPS